jgi:hypothetical protein
MKKSLILLILCLNLLEGKSQFYQAVHGSNFGGSLGMMNNPASALNSPKPWDITLFGFQVRNSTNLLYLERYGPTKKQEQLLAFYKNGDFKKRFNNALNLNIINTRLRVSNKTAIGFGINVRSASNASSSTYNYQDSLSHINSFFLINDQNQPLQASVTNSTWLELFGTIAHNLIDSKNLIWNAGVSMKANKGMFGFVANLDNAVYSRIIPPYPFYQLNDVNLRYIYSGNVDKWDPSKRFSENFRNYYGSTEGGASIDIGMEWILKDQRNIELFDNRTQYNYTWKLGVSLLDLGFAQYKYGMLSRNFSGIKPNVSGVTLTNTFDSTITNLATFNDSASRVVNQVNYYNGKFRIAHPARLVINVDHTLSDVLSINTELNIPVSFLSSPKYQQIHTIPSLTITPRMEGSKYGAYLPLTITSDGFFWVGAAVKAGPLLLGMHNILPFFQKIPYPNGGGYLAYVISPSEKLRKVKSKDVKCPD